MNKRLKQITHRLRERNIEFKVVSLTGPAISVKDVVRRATVPVKIEEICKTILLKGKTVFGVFLRGTDRIDFEKLKEIQGSKIRLLNKQEIKNQFGFELGEVCPLFLDIVVFVDKDVLKLENVHFGSGDLLNGLEMKSGDILKCINYKIENVVV